MEDYTSQFIIPDKMFLQWNEEIPLREILLR